MLSLLQRRLPMYLLKMRRSGMDKRWVYRQCLRLRRVLVCCILWALYMGRVGDMGRLVLRWWTGA